MSEKPIRECEAEALRLNKEGYSNSAIGQHIGVHRNTIRKWLKKHGVAPKVNGDMSDGKVLDNLIQNTKVKDKVHYQGSMKINAQAIYSQAPSHNVQGHARV